MPRTTSGCTGCSRTRPPPPAIRFLFCRLHGSLRLVAGSSCKGTTEEHSPLARLLSQLRETSTYSRARGCCSLRVSAGSSTFLMEKYLSETSRRSNHDPSMGQFSTRTKFRHRTGQFHHHKDGFGAQHWHSGIFHVYVRRRREPY